MAAGCKRDRKQIAVIPKATSHLFWVSVQAGAFAAGQEFGVEVLWNGPALETDFSRQIQIVDSMTARRVDGIALAAAERKALVQSVDRAMAAGIPVTIFDSGLDSTNYMSFVATDNYAAGKLAASTLGRLLNGNGKAAVVLHVPGSFSTMERERGFEDGIKEFPGINVVQRQYGMSDRAKALAAAENILTAHPDLDGIFASTEPSSLGAALALKARGLSDKVVQDPFRMGHEAVRSIVDKLNGATPPKRLDLEAIVVSRENLEQPDIRKVLFPDVKRFVK
jgi:ribose transport system substrate-binding protein